jgi:hypothetical protein
LVKIPTGFGRDLSNAFTKQNQFNGLISHDFLYLLRYFVPLAKTEFAKPDIQEAISRLSRLICWITFKSISKKFFSRMKAESTIVVNSLEMQFLTSFFDSRVHQLIYVVGEIKIVGPIKNRGMFFIKCFL